MSNRLAEKNGVPGAAAPGILEALEAAGESDLARLDEEVAACRRRLEALEAARKLVHVKLHGRPERAKPGPRKARAADPAAGPKAGHRLTNVEYQRRLVEILGRAGAMMLDDLAREAGLHESFIERVTAGCPWFERTGRKIHITSLARQQVL